MSLFSFGGVICDLLISVFEAWNSLVDVVFGLLIASPEEFKDGGPWQIIEEINPIFVAVGSSLVVIFGPVFITILASKGVHPVLAAAMLPCICGVMCGITPPLGLGMYAGMSLANSDFGKTFKNNLWWVAAQYVMEVIVLMGWLPAI